MIRRFTNRMNARFLDPRGPSAPAPARVLFWLTLSSAAVARVAVAHFEGQFFPVDFPHHPVTYFALLASVVPMLLLWPLLPWTPEASGRDKLASLGFLTTTYALFPVLDFGVHSLMFLAVAHAVCVFGKPGGAATSFTFGLVNLVVQTLHPKIPQTLVLTNAVVLAAFGLGVTAMISLLISAAERARRTEELLTELAEAHHALRHYAARTRELAVAEERTRMAREMHDSTGHYLTAINVCLANAERSTTELSDRSREDIGEARELAKEALAETRRWVRALKPLNMEGRTGFEAIRALTETFVETGVTTTFHADGAWPEDMDGESELAAYRAAQEGLTNALRHSGADRIEVSVSVLPGSVLVEVADNGNGASMDTTAAGFGLAALSERLRMLGGELRGHDRPGGGFVLTAEVPLRPTTALEAHT